MPRTDDSIGMSLEPSRASTLAPASVAAETPAALPGVISVVLATVLWAASAILIDRLSVLYHLTSLQISFWRVLICLPVIVLAAARRPAAFLTNSRDLVSYVILGVVGITATYMLWTVSVQINKPTAATALSFSAPAYVALGDRFVFGTPLGPVQAGAIAVNLAGCMLASGVRSPAELMHSPAGLVIGLLNGLTFGFYTLLGRGLSRTGRRDQLTVLLYMFTFGAISLLIWGLAAEGTSLLAPHLDAIGWLLLAGLALGPTLASYALYNVGLQRLPATVASLISTFEPPVVALLSLVILGRAVLGLQWAGIALIVIGVVTMQESLRRRRASGRLRAQQ